MTDKISSNGLGLRIRVYHPPTYLMPPSPPTSSMTDLHEKDYVSMKSNVLKDFESKEQTKEPVAESDVEVPHFLSRNAETYQLEKYNKNVMFIFNHTEFLDGGKRRGTMRDEEALRQTFARFRFDVHSFHDLRRSQLLKIIDNFVAQTDFSQYGCLCIAILTHGHGEPGYLYAYDDRFREDLIFDAFNVSKNRTLVAKPIIFLIEACRGLAPSRKVTMVKSKYQLDLDDSDDNHYHLPHEADRIVFHSSAVGRASVRHVHDGSWFIQTLCRNINRHADTCDLESIFMRVRKEVALDFVNSKDWKQMPVVTSTLIRKLFLANPDKSTPVEDTDCEMHSILGPAVEKPKELTLKTPDESLDSSQTMINMTHMPCSCFLDYFEYMTRCLEHFVELNPQDLVAEHLSKMTKKVGNGAEYNFQKFEYIKYIWEHLDANMDKFPPGFTKFLYRSPSCVKIPLESGE